MSISQSFRFLRPFAYKELGLSKTAAYLRFYTIARSFNQTTQILKSSQAQHTRKSKRQFSEKHHNRTNEPSKTHELESVVADISSSSKTRHDIKKRIEELQSEQALEYPRIHSHKSVITCAEFRNRYAYLKADETQDGDLVTLRGRVYSSRIAGSKLVFLDIHQDGVRIQGLCNRGVFEVAEDDFKDFCRLVRRGDIISITGTPSRTKRGELSLNATTLPVILTPALASLPATLEDREKRIRNRHADLLVNKRTVDTLKLRSHIIQYIRNFLLADRFHEVQTPIIADAAGGAIARPFITSSTEFPQKILSLRIAPELWLKRLILGGMDRVFEIGPVFRNEGLDATHNPEFTTCEFYKSFADLEELIAMTESLISGMVDHVNLQINTQFTSLTALDAAVYDAPFARIEFIPALEKALGQKLPNLEAENATEKILLLFSSRSLPLPSSTTLPRLLDKLCSLYLEPNCFRPTFITHHPACLAPLAKSFIDPTTNQLVSARVELFIQHKEIANMYEEENSPFEQRRKFLQQGQWRDDENSATVDENYIEALEWGLPPTGGWGCGIDRICMLFADAQRVSDVLSFGSLKNVTGLSRESNQGKVIP